MPRQQQQRVVVAFYALLFAVTFLCISGTLYRYPLFPIRADNLDWSAAWLAATVADYYGSTLCLCGIVLSSEPSLCRGLAWSAGFCLLGSPVCCVWTVLWLRRNNYSLALERRDNYEQVH